MIDFSAIAPLDRSREAEIRTRIDGKAKPPGSLGRIEDLAVQLALIADGAEPHADRARLLVFAGDHGLNDDKVSAYPSSVTAAMVATLLAGKAGANAFARAVGAEVVVVDAGVDAKLAAHPGLFDAKVRRGTRNAAREPALTPAEVELALQRGFDIAQAAAAEGVEVFVLGEMGIGDSAAAALVLHRLAPAPLADCVGRGAGHDEAGLAHKLAVLARAGARSDATEPLDVLAQFGGLEIIMTAGAVLGAAAARRPAIVDGFISGAGALAAIRLAPAARDYCIFAHRSAERGHGLMLQALAAEPLLDLGLRLGEGSGALLALPLVRAAARLLTDVATLDEVLEGRL